MAKILTENYRIETSKQFLDSFSSDNYYVFGSSVDKENDIENSQKEKRDFLRRTIFGRKVNSDDIKHLFNKNDWVQGTIYDAFDDTKDLSTLNMYVNVLAGNINESSYYVYKCLDNNNGSPSTVEPSTVGTGNSQDDFIFSTNDGYVWKFLFEVTPSDYLKYQTNDELPYSPYQSVIDSARESISDIIIESSVSNLFSSYVLGDTYVESVEPEQNDNYDTKISLRLDPSYPPLQGENEYVGMYLFVEDTGKFYDIVNNLYIPAGSQTEATLDLYVNKSDSENILNKKVSVVPKVIVSKSNTSGETDAKAWVEIDNDGNLIDIRFFERGSGYKYATAKLSLPVGISNQTNNVLRVVVSPDGGHGSNPISELSMSKLVIVSDIVSTNTNIPNNNTYTKVGLVKNPTFSSGTYPETFDNRMLIQISRAGQGDFTNEPIVAPGSVIEQTIGDETITAKIHEVGDYYPGTPVGYTELFVVDYSVDSPNVLQNGAITIKNETSSLSVNINNVNTDNTYTTYTGQVLNYIDFDQIERQPDRTEKVKLIFDF